MNSSRPSPDPEEIIVLVDVVFTIWFERDEQRGGYIATCAELPAVAGLGKTLRQARSDARTEIKLALQDLAEDGDLIPPLIYAPPWLKNRLWRPDAG